MRPLLFMLAAMAIVHAHDAPARVTVQLHLRPTGSQMHALVRIPLEAVRDVDFPAQPNGYLDVDKLAPRLNGLAKIWVADVVELYEEGARTAAPRITATQLSLQSDRSFDSYNQAAARLRAPLPTNSDNLVWKQLFFDVALEFPIGNARAAFSLKPAFANLGESVHTVLHYGERTLLFTEDPGVFPLDPTWLQSAWLFLRLGFAHILAGLDHLLFLLCLVISSRRLRSLLWVVTAFTVAHSVTLIASGLGLAPGALWFPPAVELVIAISIVYLALSNIAGHSGEHSWLLAFGFGLVHGFGFSFALRESLQLAGSHLLAALLAFNLGVELGQLAALAVMVPALLALFRYAVAERLGTIILSALVAHTGWHWMWERAELLRNYSFTMPAFTAANGALALRWLMLGMALWAFVWLVRRRQTQA